jgi:sterol desaturase/sphingolipid hydroxylase (fatty acid hydroxylase superfamily)
MSPEDLIGLSIPLTWLVFLAIEARWPARTFPSIPRWRWIGGAFVVVLLAINAVLPSVLPASWFAAIRVVDLSGLALLPAVVVGYLTVSLANYAFQRAEHRFAPLWRAFHQLHHSPVRMDVAGAAYTTPQEVGVSVVIFLTVVGLLGLDPLAAALVGYVGAFYSMFQHLDVRTPRWIGYLIERPESHCLHHEFAVHARNYSDLPLWDIVFGTFQNPATFEGRVGFEAERARRVGAMLVGRDVHAGASVTA